MDSVVVEENVIKNTNSYTKKIKHFQDLITSEDVEIIKKRAFGSTPKIIDYHIRTYSEEQLGFLGNYHHLVVTIQRPGNTEKEIYTFFLKSIPYNNENQISMIEDSNAFHKEANFYKLIVPELMSGVEDKSWLAKCYLVKDDVLVFEDLKSKNFSLKDKILSVNALKSALAVYAKFHASSMLAEKRLGKTFRQLYPELLEESVFVRNGKFNDWVSAGVDVIVAVTKHLGFNDSCFPQIRDRVFHLISAFDTRKNVICHGDPKSYNMLFDNSEPLPKCVLVDFQLIRYVPPMVDIAQMIYLNTRRQFREENEETLLRYYHEVLCDTLKKNDKDITLPSFCEILNEYEELRVMGIATAALCFPLYLINGKECAEMTIDSESFSKILFDDRIDLTLEIMKKDSTYNEIMTEIVTEIVQRSKYLLSS